MLEKNSTIVVISLLVLLVGCKMEYIGDEITHEMAETSFPDFSPKFPPNTEFVYWRELYSGDQYRVLLKGKVPYPQILGISRSFGIDSDDFSSEFNPHTSVLGKEFLPYWDPRSLTHFQSAYVEAETHDQKPVVLTFTYEDELSLKVIRFYIEYIVFID